MKKMLSRKEPSILMKTHKEPSVFEDIVVISAVVSFLIVFLSSLYFGEWTIVGNDDKMLGEMVSEEVMWKTNREIESEGK